MLGEIKCEAATEVPGAEVMRRTRNAVTRTHTPPLRDKRIHASPLWLPRREKNPPLSETETPLGGVKTNTQHTKTQNLSIAELSVKNFHREDATTSP